MHPTVTLVGNSEATWGEPAFRLSISYHQRELARQIQGARWNAASKTWDFPQNEFTAQAIHEALSTRAADFAPEFLHYVENLGLINPDSRESKYWAKPELDGVLEPIPSTAFEPWRHQLEAYHFLLNRNHGALFMEMGTGKTKVMIDLINNRPDMKRILILCPLSVCGVWKSEVPKHSREESAPQIRVMTKGTAAQKVVNFQDTLGRADLLKIDKLVCVLNYDSAWRNVLAAFLLEGHFDTVILDESHRAKSPKSKIGKFLASLGQVTPKRFLLTGTPLPHSPMDIYQQYRFMDPSIFGRNFAQFRAVFALLQPLPSNPRVQIVAGYRNLDELHKRIYHSAFRVTKDVLDLPEEVETTYYYPVPKKAQKVYCDVVDALTLDLEAFHEGHEAEGLPNALVKVLRMQQILSGFTRAEGEHDVELFQDKANYAADIVLHDTTGKVVIFSLFQKSITKLRMAFKSRKSFDLFELSGNRPRSSGELDVWVEYSGDGRAILFVQIQSGGVGIDLTEAHTALYYDLTYNLGNYEQSKARIHRPGQKDTCQYIQLLAEAFDIQGRYGAEAPIDSQILDVLRNRKNFVESVLKRKGKKMPQMGN